MTKTSNTPDITFMVGSYTTGLTMYADTEAEAMQLIHDHYSADDAYVFIDQIITY